MCKHDILCHHSWMVRNNTSSRLERLDLLASRLKAEDQLTIPILAAEFGVSGRTIARDVAILRSKGLPIETDSGRGGGIRINRMWGIGRVTLNHQEAIELLFSISIAEKLDAPWLFQSLSAVKRKLTASLSPAMQTRIKGLRQRIHVGSSTTPQILSGFQAPVPDNMAAVFRAFTELRRIQITYSDSDGKITCRSIEPHHLLLTSPVWYLLAWDMEKEAIRMFRCDRIQHGMLEEETFSERPYELFGSAIEGTKTEPIRI